MLFSRTDSFLSTIPGQSRLVCPSCGAEHPFSQDECDLQVVHGVCSLCTPHAADVDALAGDLAELTDDLLALDPEFDAVCDARLEAAIADREERAFAGEMTTVVTEADTLFAEEVARRVALGWSQRVAEQMAAKYVAAVCA